VTARERDSNTPPAQVAPRAATTATPPPGVAPQSSPNRKGAANTGSTVCTTNTPGEIRVASKF
jgi:hypothetical protein